MNESRIILTPECHNLWLLSPRQLLIYDRVVVDKYDLEKILNPPVDSPFAIIKSKCAEKLIKWGFVEEIDYRNFISDESRKYITFYSKRLIGNYLIGSENIFNSKFYKLALYAHDRYARFLEQSILACPLNDKSQLKNLSKRLNAIKKRIKRLHEKKVSDDFLEKIKWTLERIASKALAGILITKEIGGNRLYDTDEYKPFVDDIINESFLEFKDFLDDTSDTILPALVSALSKKPLPDVTLLDEYNLFLSIREKSEFVKIRKILKELEIAFQEIETLERNEIIRKKIIAEIDRLNRALNQEISTYRNKFISKRWFFYDMIAGQFIGFLSPFVNLGKKLDEKKIKDEYKKKLTSQDLTQSLFFLMEIWERESSEYQLLKMKQEDLDEESIVPIWGEKPTQLPWYEQE